jgi:hypothetical protein
MKRRNEGSNDKYYTCPSLKSSFMKIVKFVDLKVSYRNECNESLKQSKTLFTCDKELANKLCRLIIAHYRLDFSEILIELPPSKNA